MKRIKHLAKRAQSRGAAMPEGIIVISTMLVFLGTTVYAEKAYGGKVDQMTETRKDALFYASHHCDDDKKPPSTQPVADSADPGGSRGSVDAVGNNLGNNKVAAQAGISRDWNTSQATLTGSASYSASVNTNAGGGINLQKVVLTAQLATTSYVGCNEKRYDNPWTAIFEFGWDFLKSGAGAAGGP